MDNSAQILLDSFMKLEKWIEDHDYKGYEAFDGLTSFLFPLTSRNLLGMQVLQQVVRRFPVNLRPLLGVKPLDSTKGRGFVAWGYLRRYRQTGDMSYKTRALACLDWLDKNKSPLYPAHSWGNQFPYAARGGQIKKDVSTIVWTGLIGQVFLEAFELFGEKRLLEVIKSIETWILALPREHTKNGHCLSYIMEQQRSIHNSNMIGAGFLAGSAKLTGNREALELAHKSMAYSCTGQLTNGAWYYGEAEMYHWIDVFHSGYNLDSLKRYIDFSGDMTFKPNLEKGFTFFKNNFFEPSGRVKYYWNNPQPTDIQCCSQAIDTLLFFSNKECDCRNMALNAALWTIKHMQDKDGHFYFRVYPLGIKAKAPMIHWGQATMYKALAHLIEKGQIQNGLDRMLY